MSGKTNFERILWETGRAIAALQPYVDEVILVGGLVPFVYRHFPDYIAPSRSALFTTEADLSIPPKVKGAIPIRKLMEAAGFRVETIPAIGRPLDLPTQRFQRSSSAKLEPTYIEFLTPMRGSDQPPIAQPQPGLFAPRLRYLDLFNFKPLRIDLARISGFEVDEGTFVRVPNPLTFILQKPLCRKDRAARGKQSKDMAYVYEVAAMTRRCWANLATLLVEIQAHDPHWSAWTKRALTSLEKLFASPASDGTQEVLQVLDGDTTATAVHRTVTSMLQQLKTETN